MVELKEDYVVPGQRVGVIEEFTSSGLTYEDRGEIRSLILGKTEINKADRSIAVTGPGLSSPFPLPGDYVEGIVESLTGAGGVVRIYMVNDVWVSSDLTGMLRSHDRRGSSLYKLGDVVRCIVSSLVNNTIWLDMDHRDSGVIRTFCSVCGGNVNQVPPDKVSCLVCGNVENRKLIGFRPPMERTFRRGFREGFRGRFPGSRKGRFRFSRSRGRRQSRK